MNAKQPQSKIAELEAEEKRIRSRMKRRVRLQEQDKKRLVKLERQIDHEKHKEKLKELVGKPGAVKIRYRKPVNDKDAFLNDAAGTLIKLARKWAHVTFDGLPEHERNWDFPIEDLIPVDQSQGMTVFLK